MKGDVIECNKCHELYDRRSPCKNCERLNKPKILFNQLSEIITTWKDTNYPDTPNTLGYLSALKRLYEGRYDVEAAEYLIEKIVYANKR